YLHTTSRALDPQLHRHLIVANMGASNDSIRALDGTALFAHAKTAGYLAAAELRFQLTRRLGVAWGQVVHGIAEIDGVPDEALRAMSTRAPESQRATAAQGVDIAPAPTVAP